mmetsp:Transcript_50709/g.107578  ORF Transcript_50709/g.107578 Transcript_50709/m.107578 type:complete len:890 (-) Transcript_50709:120-2789(-)
MPAKQEFQARFIPNTVEFKKNLCALDFFKDIVDDQRLRKNMAKVPDHFQDDVEYLQTMEPLYWEEVKQEIQRAKEMEMEKTSETVRLVDYRLEHPFTRIDFRRSKEEASIRMFSQFDLVLFSQHQDPRNEDSIHFLALVEQSFSNSLNVWAIPTMKEEGESDRMKAVARLVAQKSNWFCTKVLSTQTMVREFEALKSVPHIPLKDFVLNQEEAADATDAGTEMQAAPGVKSAEAEEVKVFSVPKIIEDQFLSMYNDSQRQAILDSRKINGITLVQGPPGTGKTKTILGILTVLSNSRAKVRHSATIASEAGMEGRKRKLEEVGLESDDDDDDKDLSVKRKRQTEAAAARLKRMRNLQGCMPWLSPGFVSRPAPPMRAMTGPGDPTLTKPYKTIPKGGIKSLSELAEEVAPQKVLVCTPSNAAVDEVLRRVSADGIMDSTGRVSKRSLVRLGPNFHETLKEFSLEEIVKQRLLSKSESPDLTQMEVEKENTMRNAAILFSTWSISGNRDMVGYPGDFDTVVMDEASQGLEVSALIPLKLGCKRLIMVGDPKQLPATCFSAVAKQHRYERSLFQRLQESNMKVNMLQIQYRMHPAISSFPSQRFYEGKLQDAWDTAAFESRFPAPWWSIPCFGPVVFFNLRGVQEKMTASFVNEDEANFIIQIFRRVSALYPDIAWRERLAVISPYALQVKLLRQKFRALYNLPAKSVCPVEVNTVDSFQGREKDIIIVSAVRADIDEATIGFVRDKRRMNVAFTRARQSLWVVGYAEVLSKNQDWRQFVKTIQQRKSLLKTSKPYESFLKRYLRQWYDQHPQLARPSHDIIGAADDPDDLEDPIQDGEFTISVEELEDLEEKDLKLKVYDRPDIEEVPDEETEDATGDDSKMSKSVTASI